LIYLKIKSSSFKWFGLPLVAIILASLVAPAMANTSPVPPEVLLNAKDWPLPNKDYGNSRTTSDSEINSANVKNLQMVWSVPVNYTGPFGSVASNPLIIGDTIYLQDLGSNIYSITLKTGKVNWMKRYNLSTIGPNGPAVGYGKVFAAKGVNNLAALAMDTGKELWAMNISTGQTVGIDIQPVVYNNTVYTSTVPGSSASNFYTGGSIGVIYALDQQTGKAKWNFSTVDSADIWGNKEVNSGGGCWYMPAIDLHTGLMFWGTGNPAPWPGTSKYPSGSSRPGPNLYTDSLLALDSSDGRLKWYSQVNPHDLFDHDFQISPMLASTDISGKQQEIVIGAGKMGKVYAFNRSTGAILWSTLVGVHQNDQLASLPDGTTTVYPGYLGGVETPMAYADGLVYVPYVDLYVNYTATSIANGQSFNEGKGGLAALDVTTGKIIWDEKFESLNFGGATVVNDLIFTATYDGTIYAFQKNTGIEVWRFKAPAGINAWPAVTKDIIIWPCGVGEKPSLIALSYPSVATAGP
jgi:alcohol dehydrogenase (cytochrome c)